MMASYDNDHNQDDKQSDLINRYLDGLMSGKEREVFEERCFRDDAFFQEVRAREVLRGKVAKVIQKDGQEIFHTPPPHVNVFGKLAALIKGSFPIKWERQPRWGYVATAMGAVAVVTLVILTTVGNKPDVRELYAQNFEAVPFLEDMIEESTRSAGGKVESVYAPRIGEAFDTGEIVFQWRMADRVPVLFKILNNFEEEILASTPALGQFPIVTVRVETEMLREPGLFYWRIEDNNDILFVGKFLFLRDPR